MMSNEDLEKRRIARLRDFAIAQARTRFDADYPDFVPEEIVASICAYEEEGNIGDVLKKMPDTHQRQSLHDLRGRGWTAPTRPPRSLAPSRASRSLSFRSISATASPCRSPIATALSST